MHQLNLTVAICAGAVFVLGLISERIQLSPISRPLLALAAGVLFGPLWIGLVTPEFWPQTKPILKEAARFTLAISVTGIALRTPREDFRRFLRPIALLLSIGILTMWLVSSGLAWAVLGVSPLLALALGSVVTPTDPVVASSIVTGRHAEKILPDSVRSTLSLESGANDGLAYLIVLLPVILMDATAGPEVWSRWLWDVLVVGGLAAVAIGGALGWFSARLLRRADRFDWIEKHSLLGASIALSVLAVTLAKLAGSDGILAAFAAGVAFNLGIDRREDFDEQNVQETISKLFSLPVFVILGAALPFGAWAQHGWPLVAFALALLLLRRPLALVVVGPLTGRRIGRAGLVHLGWFGPVGIAAIYYALLVEERTGEAIVWEAASMAVAGSVLLHGMTSGPGLRLYHRYGPKPQG